MLKTYEVTTRVVVIDTHSGKTYIKKYSTVALYHSESGGQPVSFEVEGENILDYLYQDNKIGQRLKTTIAVKDTRKKKKVRTIMNWYDDENDRIICWLKDCKIHFERTVEETSLTLKKMMETFKADEVIEYCVERGLSCLPQ